MEKKDWLEAMQAFRVLTLNHSGSNLVDDALFYLGDGHAVQGDGEIVGTGIETSFDVQFTVQLIKGRGIGWPRAENQNYIMTVGNARPLDQALQHATTEMVCWLVDLGL